MKVEDQRRRSIVKALSWRALATFTTMLIVYLITGEPALSIGVGVIEVISKMVLYYGHERLWSRLAWGRDPSGTKDRRSTPDQTRAGAPADQRT